MLGVGERVPVRRLDDARDRDRGSDQVTNQTTMPAGLYWIPGVWDHARSAYIADPNTNADSPGSFARWIVQSLDVRARSAPTAPARHAPGRRRQAARAGQHLSRIGCVGRSGPRAGVLAL